MSDKFIEKTFLYLVALSVLLHVAVFAVFFFFPEEKRIPRQEPYMVEMRDMPPGREKPALKEKVVRNYAEKKRRVPRATAPLSEMEHEQTRAVPSHDVAPAFPQPKKEAEGAPRSAERGEMPLREKPAGDFFKRKAPGVPDLSRLFPSADKLAKLEEGYRQKYGPEVAEGEATFLNTNDLQFGSFLRRFESAVYGVWRYPADAARLGIEGVTPVRIVFNRKGEIEKIDILESSGSRILDDEVRRTLKLIGPVGGFPRGYDKENYNLIAFFHYGIVRGMIQGTLQ
jgi:protein TonB